MRSLLISLLVVLLAAAIQAEVFKKEKVKLGKKTCLCDFNIEIGNTCSGSAKCDKKCSGSGTVELGGCSFTLAVKKGKGKISKCSCEAATVAVPTEPTTGSGSGETPIPITGSGSGETPVPITGSGSGETPVPITGSGSGETPVPITGSGSGGPPPAGGEGMQCSCKCSCPDGSGECDCDCNCPMTSKALTCAPGFSKVCPMMGDMCPQDMDPVCPYNAMSRMAGNAAYEGMDKGCQCVPDFLLDMVMIQPTARMEAVDRAMTKATIQVGKKKCKCSYEMNAENCKKSKIVCDKKCSGKATGVELADGDVMYMVDMAIKKGKVTISKCDVDAPEPTGTGGGSAGSGSGNGEGEMGGMGSRCACVSKGMGGSGPTLPTLPPTGSGSEPAPPTGSGSEPAPPTGSGSEPPTGSGSGSGSTGAEDVYVTQAKALIDAGTCGSVTASSVCGDDVAGYYNQFEYNGMLVVVSSGAPDHPAEHDQLVSNPNTRCERWQFMQVPLNPAKGSGVATGMGTVGLAVTGGGFFNHLSNPDGALALANEGPTLDSCLGHSAGGGTYHYHANINCTDAGAASGANDADTCLKIGYYRDGVPVYGFCKDSNGVQMTSCYSLVSGSTTSTVVTISGTYDVASTNTAYEYNPTPDCNLDEGNGAIHPSTGQYSYFVTTGYPWVPVNYNGEEGASRLCGLGL